VADGGEFSAGGFAAIRGGCCSKTSNRIQLKVKRDQVIAVCKQLLDELPVNDIDIQEVPIEEVIRQNLRAVSGRRQGVVGKLRMRGAG